MKTLSSILLLIFLAGLILTGCDQHKTGPEQKNGSHGIKIDIENVKAPDWSDGLPVYQVFLQRHTKEGTINAFRERLPELKELGVGIIWFMPIHPMSEAFEDRRNPFSIKDHFGITPDLGTKEDLKKLVNEIHQLGMYTILGVVPNHTGWDHPLIEEHPEYYEHNEDGSIAQAGPWENIAQLDYSKEEVRQWGISYLTYWIKEFNFDGYRCDVAARIPDEFWNRAIPEVRKIKSETFFLAESHKGSHYKLFDMVYDWSMPAFLWKITWNEWPATQLDLLLLKEKPHLENGALIMRHMDNHDVHNSGYAWPMHQIIPLERLRKTDLYEKYGDALKVANLLYATFPGKYMIYNGQEIGYKEKLPHNTLIEKSIEWKNSPLKSFYQSLFELHKNNPAIYEGDFLKLKTNADRDVYAFLREQGDNKVLVIANLSGETQNVRINSSIPEGKWRDYFGQISVNKIEEVHLNRYGYKVFIKENNS